MRVHGTLLKWNDDRGFGFVALPQTQEEIFVHISAFPRDGVRPVVGEIISFNIQQETDGKKRAVAVERPGKKRSQINAPKTNRKKSSGFSLLVSSILALSVVFGVYKCQRPVQDLHNPSPSVKTTTQEFSCDGRTQCGQMRSCDEARYFLAHCSGVEMDGDGDGIPCERQWCHF